MKIQELVKSHPVAIYAGLSALIFFGLGFWRKDVASADHETLLTREAESARLSANIHNAQKLDAQLNQIKAISEKINGRLSNPSDVATNQQYFYKLEADNGVKLIDLHQVATSNKKKKDAVVSSYSTVGYSLSVQGDYLHLLKFLRAVESGARITRIVSAGMTAGKNRSDSAHPDTGESLFSVSLKVDLLGSL